MTARLAILADDLTGAADTGAPFAAAGRSTVVLLSPEAPVPLPSADVLVITSDSRALPSDEAAAATRRCATRIVAWCQGNAAVRVYKKIDSTLRGHPALELQILMEALGERTALVAPAFPAQGRTTVGGRQCVNGVPIERTALGQDGVTSDLGALFTRSAGGAVAALSRADLQRGVEHLVGRLVQERGIRLWIADAEDESDLAVLAAAALASPVRMLCGSAGLARAIATDRRQGLSASRRNVHDGRRPRAEGRVLPADGRRPNDEGRHGVLVVAGSRHATTAAQVDALRRRGAVVVHPELPCLEGTDPSGAARSVAHVADILATGRHAVLSTTELPDVSAGRVVVAARLASIVAGVCDRVRVGGLVLTGGDTASAVCHALESSSLWLTGELQPGIATGTLIGGRQQDLPIVTKAGGFGDETALQDAVSVLDARGS